MNICYIRLNTGDEVIADAEHFGSGDTIILNNPLMIEIHDDDDTGTQMIFFSRYNPYAKDTSVEIQRNNVVILQTASDAVSEYYIKSVDFCKSYIDKKFSKGIATATTYVDQVLKQLSMNGMIDEDQIESPTEEEEFINDQEEVPNQKPTVH